MRSAMAIIFLFQFSKIVILLFVFIYINALKINKLFKKRFYKARETKIFWSGDDRKSQNIIIMQEPQGNL